MNSSAIKVNWKKQIQKYEQEKNQTKPPEQDNSNPPDLPIGEQISLNHAKVISVTPGKTVWKNHFRAFTPLNFVVKDPKYDVVFFSSFSEKVESIHKGDIISVDVVVNGRGEPNPKYPNSKGIIFTRKPKNIIKEV